MTYVITEACIDVKDKSCIEVCPVDCIYSDDEDRICYVEPNACIDCGICEQACPVQAIFPEEALARESIPFIEINSLWFADKAAARAKVDASAP